MVENIVSNLEEVVKHIGFSPSPVDMVKLRWPFSLFNAMMIKCAECNCIPKVDCVNGSKDRCHSCTRDDCCCLIELK